MNKAVERGSAASIPASFKIVERELTEAARRLGVSTDGSYVEVVRRLRDSNYLDSVFSNHLERLARMRNYAEVCASCGQRIASRRAKEYVALALDATRHLRYLRHAA